MSRAIDRLKGRSAARRAQYPSDLVILGEDEGITEYDHDVQEAMEEALGAAQRAPAAPSKPKGFFGWLKGLFH